MSLYYLIFGNQVDILQKHFKKDHVHMRFWTRFYGRACSTDAYPLNTPYLLSLKQHMRRDWRGQRCNTSLCAADSHITNVGLQISSAKRWFTLTTFGYHLQPTLRERKSEKKIQRHLYNLRIFFADFLCCHYRIHHTGMWIMETTYIVLCKNNESRLNNYITQKCSM